MAEILLSLTIIGVVAAITLPSLTGNINERTWNTQRKALYARISQAVALMPALNGYGTFKEASSEGASDAVDTAAETFLTSGLSKVLKINNICDNEHLEDCGIVTSYTNLKGNKNSIPTKLSELNSTFTSVITGAGGETYQNPQKNIDTKAAAFETANGESIVIYYNPKCAPDMQESGWHYSQPKMCVNFIYDLNGTKGPNTIGKDMGFITALYPSDSVIVAPMPLSKQADSSKQNVAGEKCTKLDSESRLPNRDELSAIFYNKELVGSVSDSYWSSTVISSGEQGLAWFQNTVTGIRRPFERSHPDNVLCIKR